MLDPYLLCIFKDGFHRSKTAFMLGPSSGVNLTSDTDKPRPSAHDIAVVGGRKVNYPITGFHGL